MDSITHVALGAIIGEAFAGKSLGRKAMAIGAIAQCVPDADFVVSLWLRPVDNLLAHRGIMHSLLFCLIISTILGVLTARWLSSAGISGKKWVLFFILQISLHLVLDALNSYGLGWLEPFSHQRIAFDIIYVADPFYSIWLGIGCVALLLLKKKNPSARTIWVGLSLALSTLYLLYTFYNKQNINADTKDQLSKVGVVYSRFMTTPTPLNNWLWYIIAESDSGYFVGYRSVFDGPHATPLTYFPQQTFLLQDIKDREDLQKLKFFSQGYYTVERQNDALLFNDLRFGQIAGWVDPRAPFAFHYDLLHPENNLFVVQQGRFSKWNGRTIHELFGRIVPHP